jgi:hypothetical protein
MSYWDPSAGKALGAGVGFRGVPRVGGKDEPFGDWVDHAA